MSVCNECKNKLYWESPLRIRRGSQRDLIINNKLFFTIDVNLIRLNWCRSIYCDLLVLSFNKLITILEYFFICLYWIKSFIISSFCYRGTNKNLLFLRYRLFMTPRVLMHYEIALPGKLIENMAKYFKI